VSVYQSRDGLTQDGLLKLAVVVYVKEFPSSKRERHALVVLLQLIVDLRRDKGRQLSLRKLLVLVESLTVRYGSVTTSSK
jgi:hypothetical protein